MIDLIEKAKKNTIIYAGYGYEGKILDVTEKIKIMYKNNIRSFKAENSISGDPFPGKVKALYIIWLQDGIAHSSVIYENDGKKITLPDTLTI